MNPGGGGRKPLGALPPRRQLPYNLRGADHGDPNPPRTAEDVYGDTDPLKVLAEAQKGARGRPATKEEMEGSKKEDVLGVTDPRKILSPEHIQMLYPDGIPGFTAPAKNVGPEETPEEKMVLASAPLPKSPDSSAVESDDDGFTSAAEGQDVDGGKKHIPCPPSETEDVAVGGVQADGMSEKDSIWHAPLAKIAGLGWGKNRKSTRKEHQKKTPKEIFSEKRDKAVEHLRMTPPPPPASPGPQDSGETQAASAHPPIEVTLKGDVTAVIGQLWDRSMNAESTDHAESMRRGVMWGMLSAHEPALPSRCNRKKMSPQATHEAQAIDAELKDVVTTHKTVTTKSGGPPGEPARVESRTIRNSNRALTVKASSVAARIKNDYKRIVGLLECAHLNRRWVEAVVVALTASGIGPGTRRNWKESLKSGKSNVGDDQIPGMITALEQTLKTWAGLEDSVAVTDGESVIPAGMLDCGREVLSQDEKEEAFVYTVASLGCGSLFVSSDVCVICGFHELCGTPNSPSTFEPEGRYSIEDARLRYQAGLATSSGEGWLAAAATVHNKEQHSKNGNIDRVDDVQGGREGLLAHLKQMFWDLPPLDAHNDVTVDVTASISERHMGRVMYADARGANTYHSIAGTQHQYLGPKTTVGSLLNEWTKLRATGTSVIDKPEGAWGGTPEIPEGETLVQLFTRRTNHCQWTGAGYNTNFNHGALTLTDTGIKMVDAVVNPDPTSPSIINTQRSTMTSGFLGAAPSLGLIAQEAMSMPNDWRDLGIKTALYEDLRHQEFMQPSGVEWSWAKKDAAPIKYLCPLNRVGQWSYKATFISAQSLEAAIREDDGWLLVGQGAEQKKWKIGSSTTRVIALPDSNCPGDVGSAIWVLSHLTYPLAWVVDCYKMTINGEDWTDEAFVRTAGLVDLADHARNIIFLVPGQYREHVTLGGVSYPISVTDRYGNPQARRPALIFNIDDSLENMLHACLTSRTSLRASFTRYVGNSFCGGLNWLEIDSLITALTVR